LKARVVFRIILVLQLLLLAALPLAAQIPNEQLPIFVGQWGAVFNWPNVGIHAHVLPDGRVLTWERNDAVLTTETSIWDPATGLFTTKSNPYASLFCSGHTFLKDGKLLVAGGHVYTDGYGADALTFFDGTNWTNGPDMGPATGATAGRWYPTTTMLSNGDVSVMGGSDQGSSDPNTIPQVYQHASNTWRDLTTASRDVGLYPMTFLAPDGRVFLAGPNAQSAFLNTSGTGSWTNGPVSSRYRDYGSAVEYEPGKIILIGGGTPTATTETIDLNQANPQWVTGPNMHYARRQLNATVLPDGQVLVTGGTSGTGFNNAVGAIFDSELWVPGGGPWNIVRPQNERRLYHSTAVLLRDGSVLSIGGGQPAGTGGIDSNHYTAQIYKPNYFFKGTRPSITSSPSSVTFNQTFTIQTATSVTGVTMVRLSSVTHAFNQSQRLIRLPYTNGSGQVTVTAPSNAACPPGPYYIFILGTANVPSEGKLIYIQ
jgi:hypothetical protein